MTPIQTLDKLIQLRSEASLTKFTFAMYPNHSSFSDYIREKFLAFQDDPIHYFATLDAAHRQRFTNWLQNS